MMSFVSYVTLFQAAVNFYLVAYTYVSINGAVSIQGRARVITNVFAFLLNAERP